MSEEHATATETPAVETDPGDHILASHEGIIAILEGMALQVPALAGFLPAIQAAKLRLQTARDIISPPPPPPPPPMVDAEGHLTVERPVAEARLAELQAINAKEPDEIAEQAALEQALAASEPPPPPVEEPPPPPPVEPPPAPEPPPPSPPPPPDPVTPPYPAGPSGPSGPTGPAAA